MEIIIKYFDKTLPKIEKIEKGDWIDLYTREEVKIQEGESKLIPLNVAMKIPDGYEAHLLPRSSTFGKYHILMANSMGIIDGSYCGENDEWKFSAYCVSPIIIPKGTRIAQFRIMEKQPQISFVEGSLSSTDRGGFGSTGN